MSSEIPGAPRVFISYSHDSPEHKRWVLELATKLRSNGVDAIIDAWELRPGDDIPKFMERSVRDANRVLMICTELYVAKANDGIGGVGYEAMIVTGQLVRDLGTAKFIPVIRQTLSPPDLPSSVSTRNYVDLSEGKDLAAAIDNLVRDLHHILPEKPLLGQPPQRSFARISEAPENILRPAMPASDDLDDPKLAFQVALGAARSNDILTWRRVIARAREGLGPRLQAWFEQHAVNQPGAADALIQETMNGVAAFSPLTAIALAGIASGNPKFENQVGLLEDILNPAGWRRQGFVVRTELPESGAFVYQALHGAMALHMGKLNVALDLARTTTTSCKLAKPLPLWQRHDIVAWPESLTRNATRTWEIALGLASTWDWVAELFGDVDDYQAAIYAYYLALSTLEYIERLAANDSKIPEGELWPDVPPVFETAPEVAKRRGYRLLISAGADLRELAASIRVTEQAIRENWPRWLTEHARWNHNLNPYGFGANGSSFSGLVPEIFK